MALTALSCVASMSAFSPSQAATISSCVCLPFGAEPLPPPPLSAPSTHTGVVYIPPPPPGPHPAIFLPSTHTSAASLSIRIASSRRLISSLSQSMEST
jgi:hypothetical protein